MQTPHLRWRKKTERRTVDVFVGHMRKGHALSEWRESRLVTSDMSSTASFKTAIRRKVRNMNNDNTSIMMMSLN